MVDSMWQYDKQYKLGIQDMKGYILIVDDEPDAQEILTRIVRALGYQDQIASDGQQALEQIEANHPSLVLLDLMMPKMDGFDVLKRLRSRPATRRIPVIVVTACQPSQVDMLRMPGVAHVVQKGQFAVQDLMKLISSVLESEGFKNSYDTLFGTM